jgi:hypothetical protein
VRVLQIIRTPVARESKVRLGVGGVWAEIIQLCGTECNLCEAEVEVRTVTVVAVTTVF